MKKITIRIYRDGVIQAETQGITGPACKKYLPVIAQLVDARQVEYEFTQEYWETELPLQDNIRESL